MLGMSLWRCLEETSSTDFTRWMAFLELDPDPDVKRQFEHASTAATIESVMSGQQVKIEDRIIKYSGNTGQTRQSPEAMQDVLKQLHSRVMKKKAEEEKNPELAKKKKKLQKRPRKPKIIRGERMT